MLFRSVLKELQSAGRAGGLSGIEIIEGVVVSDEEWTPQNVSIFPPSIFSLLSQESGSANSNITGPGHRRPEAKP